MKLAVLFHRLGPYHVARLEAAARVAEVTAVELSGETREYGWAKISGAKSFARVTLFPEGDSRQAGAEEVQRRVERALHECRPDAVAIPGWSDRGALAALGWCLENRIPAVLMSESTAQDEPRVWWKEFVKRRVVRRCSAALVGGTRHADYLAQLGMTRARIFTGYDVVDNGHFAGGVEEVRGQRSEVRGARSGDPLISDFCSLTSVPFFLASARFIEKKNLPLLLRAYAEYRDAVQRSEVGGQRSEPWKLVLLGDGPLKPDLCSLISDLSLHGSVLLPGFKQYDDLPEFYARASAFVHASTTEQWGLVVNEACAAGLPVIVSNRCGCVPELVREGVNGFTFDPTNQDALAACLLEVASLPADERARFGAASREIAAQHGPEKFSEGLQQAAQLALKLPRRRASRFDRFLLRRLLHR